MKHTPGPWRSEGKSIKDLDHGKWHTIARADSRGRFLPGYDEANARLIAAAPTMKEALTVGCEAIHRAFEIMDSPIPAAGTRWLNTEIWLNNAKGTMQDALEKAGE